MTAVLVALGLAVLVFILALLILVGARREAPWTALDAEPPTPLAGFARSVMGAHIRKTNTTISPLVNGRR
ncbi:hypothetical protein GCM10023191_082180 [Actinoallomurus oryzae]|uniref:Uncharacterized protein n=1 Tax=Actinoallomurus oryzae TaxID=502180 RepID=A0ABP8QZI5_9ACTN